jgi:hypothetical protein
VAVAVLALLLLLVGGGFVIHDWATLPPGPLKAEAGFRERMRQAGVEVREFSHTSGANRLYHVIADKEGYRLNAFALVTASGFEVRGLLADRLDGRLGEEGNVRVEMRWVDDAPVVRWAYRGSIVGENEVTLTQEEEETCERLARDVIAALQEALR